MEAKNGSDHSFSISRSESKLMVEEKRSSSAEFEDTSELGRKRVKIQDLDSSEGFHTDYPNSKANHQFSYEKEKSPEASRDAPTTTSDIAPAEITRSDSQHFPQSHCVGLSTKFSTARDSAGGDMPTSAHTLSSFQEHGTEDGTFAQSRGFGWDLNAEDSSNSLNQDPFYLFKNLDHLKSDDASECGSTTGSLEEKDQMRVWKEMKENGFISSSRGGITVPKPRRRKIKTDGLKKKMELAKREQIDRFKKIAAPSGLLNELNPGIINHVRNSKQVHSIIEAVVRSEKLENRHAGGKQAISMNSGLKEITERKKDMENVSGLGTKQTSHSYEYGSLNTLSGTQQKSGFTTFSESLHFYSNDSRKDGDLSNLDGSWLEHGAQTLENPQKTTRNTRHHREDDLFALKLSSCITMASENTSSLSNEESVNRNGVSSLSVKAASVASRWLDLLHQDTKGRLTALQRSKKRLRAVIHTELPLLISREFSCNQETDPHVMKVSATGFADNTNADAHRARWSALFDQMDKSLSEEEKRLEIWLNQVKDMRLHCERGLQHFHRSTLHGSHQLGAFENDSRCIKTVLLKCGQWAYDMWGQWIQLLPFSNVALTSFRQIPSKQKDELLCERSDCNIEKGSEKADNAERELAVMAAAASIYSTSNFMLSKENLPCF